MKKSTRSIVTLVVVLLLISIIYDIDISFRANAQTSESTMSASGSIQYPPSGNLTMLLHTQGTKILNVEDQEVVWNGIDSRGLFGYWTYPVESFLNANDVVIIRSHGLNFLRVDISLDMAVRDQPVGMPTQLNYYQPFWTKLDEIVNASAQNGIWLSICFGVSDKTWTNTGNNLGHGNGFPAWMYNGQWSTYMNKTYEDSLAGRSDAIKDFWDTSSPTAANVRLAFEAFWKDIVTRYKDAPNVLFNFFNEPLEMWDGPHPFPTQAEWDRFAVMFRDYMEHLIDMARAIDAGKHVILSGHAAISAGGANPHNSNLQIRRPNVVIEDHSYLSDVRYRIDTYSDDVYQYNQPFFLGEFGGIESGIQVRADAIYSMQYCNSPDPGTYNRPSIGWAYLRYDKQNSIPSAQTWADLEANLLPNLVFYTKS